MQYHNNRFAVGRAIIILLCHGNSHVAAYMYYVGFAMKEKRGRSVLSDFMPECKTAYDLWQDNMHACRKLQLHVH